MRKDWQMWSRRAISIAALFTVWSTAVSPHASQPDRSGSTRARKVAFVNGRVFDGRRFVDKPLYVTESGWFARSKPAGADEVDLAGGYVVPPFAEGHNHNVDADGVDRYLAAGIFYVSNPATHPSQRASSLARINSTDGVDARLGGGGLTGTGGHPIFVVQRNVERGAWTEADGDGAFYFAIDTPDDLGRKWPKVLAGRPEFIKIFLLFSEEYARRRDDPAFTGWKGLNPAFVPAVVKRARAAGLRVSAHVETAADFRSAVRGGVDEVAHLPGFRPPLTVSPYYPNPDNLDAYRLTTADAEEAAKRRVVVTTTVSESLEFIARDVTGLNDLQRSAIRALIRDNLRALKTAGVPIALGSDRYRVTSSAEVREIAKLGIFAPVELLRMWSETTALMIFPERKIGRLEPGYEASLLVLAGDPTTDVENLFRIKRRVKQGVELKMAPSLQ
jgi:hypothetical protein